jgi:type I restriction enzyme S subunit
MSEEIANLLELVTAGEWGNNQGAPGGVDTGVIRSANFTKDHQFNTKEIVVRSIEERKRQKKMLQHGDILIEKSGGSPDQPVGRVLFYDLKGEHTCSNFISILRPSQQVDQKFLYYSLCNLYGRGVVKNYQQQTTGIINLQLGEYLRETIHHPPLPEQKKIAEILSGIDKTLERTKRRTTTLEAIEIATRDELFENLAKESHSERKLSEIALAPITYGIVQPGDYDPNGIILVRGQDYLQGWGKKEFFKVSPELSDKYRRSLIQPKDVLICIAGANTGDSSITPKWISNANITQTTARVRVDTNIISPEFFLEFTKSRVGRERLMNYVRGSAQPGLNLSDIEKIAIPIPGNAQQQQISNSLDSLKKLVLSSRNKEDYLKQIKKGLSSDLLSGRKRVSI